MADQSYIGKGEVFENGRFIGNVSELKLTFEEEKKEQADYTAGGGGLANSITRIKTVGVSLVAVDFSDENLSMATYGTKTAVAAIAVAAESVSAPADIADGDRLMELANVLDLAVAPVVTSDPAGTTYVEGTDYSFNSAGIVILAAGAITASLSLLVSYTKKAVGVIETLTSTAAERRLVFVGLNEAQSGAPMVITLYRAKFGPAAELSVIGDDFGSIAIAGDVLSDASIVANGKSKFANIKAA